jgi:hypothetical protein
MSATVWTPQDGPQSTEDVNIHAVEVGWRAMGGIAEECAGPPSWRAEMVAKRAQSGGAR